MTPNSQDGNVQANDEPQGDEMTEDEAIAKIQEATAAPTNPVTIEAKPLDTSSELAHSLVEADHAEAVKVEHERTGSAVVRLLEKVYTRIRENHPELPELVIVTGSGLRGDNKWGHFRAKGWNAKVAEEGAATYLDEMFMAGETLAKGARQVLQTMLHESAHTLCALRKIQDTSRQGRWHNKEFRKAAEEMGLEHPADKADKSHGYSFVKLTEATVAEYADLLAELEAEIHLTVSLPVWMGGKDDEGEQGGDGMGRAPRGEGGGSNGSNLKLVCECETPNIIRASKKVADLMVVNCGDCDSLFRPER